MPLSPAFRPVATALALAAVLATGAAHGETLQVQEACTCWIIDLSADGSAASGYLDGSQEVIRWTRAGGVQTLGRNAMDAGGGANLPGISADGQVVAASILDSTGTIATEGRWTPTGGWQELNHPLPPDGGLLGQQDSTVFGISGDGNTVTGFYWRPDQQDGLAHASVWTPATGMVGLPTDGGSSRIDDASYDGSVLVGWEESPTTGSRLATVWRERVKTTLDPEGNGSEASAVNGAGTVIVGQSFDTASQRQEATRWTWNGSGWDKQLLGFGKGATQSASSYAIATSDDGNIVGGLFRSKFSTFSSGSFIWTPESGLLNAKSWLQVNGVEIRPKKFSIAQVSAISADGRVLAFIGQELQFPFGWHSYIVTRVDVPTAKAR